MGLTPVSHSQQAGKILLFLPTRSKGYFKAFYISSSCYQERMMQLNEDITTTYLTSFDCKQRTLICSLMHLRNSLLLSIKILPNRELVLPKHIHRRPTPLNSNTQMIASLDGLFRYIIISSGNMLPNCKTQVIINFVFCGTRVLFLVALLRRKQYYTERFCKWI